MSRHIAFAFGALCVAACGALADLDGLSSGSGEAKPADGSVMDATPPTGGDAAPSIAVDAGDGGDVVVVDVDDFETALDCDGWRPVNSTAEPVPGGYTGARSCKVCRTGDMYMDKEVRLPAAGTAVVDLWMKRRFDMPDGGMVGLHLHIDDNWRFTSATPNDTWTRVTLGYDAPDGGMLGMRLNVSAGCLFIDDVRVRLDP
jgi:hypothetical protein